MLLSFSSELTSCGHWWLAEVNEMLREILFPRCFVGIFRGWNTNWAITWGMRCSVMFICAKRKEWSCSLSLCVTAQTRELELIADALINACVWFIPAHFWTVPKALQGVYTAICRAISKTIKMAIIVLISWKKNTVFVRYICVPSRKTCMEMVWYEYMYRLYIYI